jgi:hypothetical protein
MPPRDRLSVVACAPGRAGATSVSPGSRTRCSERAVRAAGRPSAGDRSPAVGRARVPPAWARPPVRAALPVRQARDGARARRVLVSFGGAGGPDAAVRGRLEAGGVSAVPVRLAEQRPRSRSPGGTRRSPGAARPRRRSPARRPRRCTQCARGGPCVGIIPRAARSRGPEPTSLCGWTAAPVGPQHDAAAAIGRQPRSRCPGTRTFSPARSAADRRAHLLRASAAVTFPPHPRFRTVRTLSAHGVLECERR